MYVMIYTTIIHVKYVVEVLEGYHIDAEKWHFMHIIVRCMCLDIFVTCSEYVDKIVREFS